MEVKNTKLKKKDKMGKISLIKNESNPNQIEKINKDENDTNIETQMTILDQIIEEYGYKWEIWKIIISVFICFVFNGYLTTSFCSYILAYKKKFNFTSSQISFLGSCFFVTKFISSFTMGYQTHYISRVTLIQMALFSTFWLNFINGVFLSFFVLIIVQTLGGIFAGIFEIASFNIACEFTPIRLRGWVMLSVWNGFNIGVLLPNIVMFFIMPNHEPEGLNKTLMVCSMIILFFGGISYFFLSDSPRNNILQGKYYDAFNILAKMKSEEYLNDEMKTKIVKEIILQGKQEDNEINDVLSNDPQKNLGGIKEIFSNGMLRTGLLLIVICFFGNIINDGFQLVLNLLLDKINKHNQGKEESVLKENILINTIDLPSNFLLGLFTEFRILGRRNTQAIGFFLLAISIFPVIFAPQNAYLYLIVFMFFTNVTNMVNVYVSEIYPTKTRDLALGVIQAVGYFGSCLSQYVFVYLNDLNFYISPIGFLVLCTCNGILSLCLKVDTYRKTLDSNIVDEEEKKKRAQDMNYLQVFEMGESELTRNESESEIVLKVEDKVDQD